MTKEVSHIFEKTLMCRVIPQAVACGALILLSGTALAANRPNILLILAEDHGAQLGAYGDPFARTPNLDRLAAEGVRFSNAYATQAGCSPSRASILTGLYPHQHGQIGLATHKLRMFFDELPNLPLLLREHGYTTGCIGKIHVNPESAFRFHYHENRRYNSFRTRDVRAVADEAEAFVRSVDNAFFLQVNFADAHDPFLSQQFGLPEQPFTSDGIEPLPFVAFGTRESLENTANYYSCLSRLDTGVGLLLERIGRTGKLENTLVIYLSDHGPEVPRGKMTSYEGGVHIPLILWMPSLVPKGGTRDQLVSTVDIMPTVLDFAGIEAPQRLPGKSLRPVLDDSGAAFREFLFTEFNLHWPETFFPQRSVRDARYKLIVNLFPETLNPIYEHHLKRTKFSGSDPFEGVSEKTRAAYELWEHPPEYELYDLKEDRWEWNNLAASAEYDEVKDRLLTALKAWQEATGDELRNRGNLEMLAAEVAGTFVEGEYRHLRNRPDFDWKYVDYLQPGGGRKVQNSDSRD